MFQCCWWVCAFCFYFFFFLLLLSIHAHIQTVQYAAIHKSIQMFRSCVRDRTLNQLIIKRSTVLKWLKFITMVRFDRDGVCSNMWFEDGCTAAHIISTCTQKCSDYIYIYTYTLLVVFHWYNVALSLIRHNQAQLKSEIFNWLFFLFFSARDSVPGWKSRK